jgi:hypothetical protein
MDHKSVSKIETDQDGLSGATAIATVALRKTWAKKATYWVTLFKLPVAATSVWVVMKSWKFPRGTEIIQGNAEAYRGSGIIPAFDHMQEVIEEKVRGGADYLVSHLVTTEGIPSDEELMMTQLTQFLSSLCEPKWGFEHEIAKAEKEKPESEFAEAMKRRKKGAYW